MWSQCAGWLLTDLPSNESTVPTVKLARPDPAARRCLDKESESVSQVVLSTARLGPATSLTLCVTWLHGELFVCLFVFLLTVKVHGNEDQIK